MSVSSRRIRTPAATSAIALMVAVVMFGLSLLAEPVARGARPTPAPTPTPAPGTTPSDLAYGWLKAQQDQYTTGLVESYNVTGQLANVCFTYDQAVAAIAFKAKGDTARAKLILDRLQALQTSSGSWYTAYNCSTLRVWESNQHVGPVLWVALAANYYGGYSTMADKAIGWTLQFQQADGGVNGGIDSGGNVISWSSTEHNEDAYAAYSKYGYSADASEVKGFLDNQVWKTDHFWGGRNDSRDPLDVNPWGVLALGNTPYAVSLDYALSHHRTVTGGFDAFDFDSDKDDIWFEGTGQMVVAFKAAGRMTDASFFTDEIVKAQHSNGGVPYSLYGTDNGYWTMSKAESVAATGWLVFAIHGINPFR